jgi:uncharacterized protein (TIGR02996 family)
VPPTDSDEAQRDAVDVARTENTSPETVEPTTSESVHLQSALGALRRGDRAGALNSLLVEWGQHRQPVVAELIERLGADIDRSLPAIESKGPALADDWLEVAQHTRSADLGRLLVTLRDGATAQQLRELVPNLMAFAADPRTTAPMVAIVGKFTSSGATPALTQALNLLAHVADPRAKKPLSQFQHTDRSWLERIYTKAQKVAAGLTAPPVADSELSKACEAIDRELKRLAKAPPATAESLLAVSDGGTGEQLLAQIFEAPDDDELRLVYADWLLEQGDRRGELIQLHYRRHELGKLKPQEAKRERELIKVHGSEWIGRLAMVASELSFDRGFLHGCTASFKTKKQSAVVDDPFWATVETVRFGTKDYERKVLEEPALLRSPTLRSLRRLDRVSAKALVEALSEPSLARLHTLGDMRVSDKENDTLQYWHDTEANRYRDNDIGHWRELCAHPPPELRRLQLRPCVKGANWGLLSGYDWLYDSPLGQKLELLRISPYVSLGAFDKLFARLPALTVLQLHAQGGGRYDEKSSEVLVAIERTETEPRSYRACLQLTRPYDSWRDEDCLRSWVREGLATMFAEFPRKDVSRIGLGLAGKMSKNDRAKLAREVLPLVEGKADEVVIQGNR